MHFIGSIVYVEQGLSQVSHQAPLLVIDGQQRLTTVSLLIEALARALGETEPLDGFSAAKLRQYYLCNALEKEDRYFKLLLSQTDNASLKALIKNTEQPKEPSLRIAQNFALFTDLLVEQKDNLVAICRGLAKLVVVDIALTRDQDNPQLIFESMNSTGRELSVSATAWPYASRLDGWLKRHGMRSSMPLCGWPSRIARSVASM